MKIEIKQIGGVWYVNNKRLGHEELTFAETQALNEFFVQYKLKYTS